MDKAKEFLQLAAEQGNGSAAHQLAKIYLAEKTSESNNLAFKWFEVAAQNGHSEAFEAIGDIYVDGEFRDRNMLVAGFWLEEAAKQDVVTAMTKTAIINEHGTGDHPKDMEKAMFYYKKAAAEGDAEAKKALKRLRGY